LFWEDSMKNKLQYLLGIITITSSILFFPPVINFLIFDEPASLVPLWFLVMITIGIIIYHGSRKEITKSSIIAVVANCVVQGFWSAIFIYDFFHHISNKPAIGIYMIMHSVVFIMAAVSTFLSFKAIKHTRRQMR
jgi:hypothetical protein